MTKQSLWPRLLLLGLVVLLVGCDQLSSVAPTPTFPLFTPSPTELPLPPNASTAARIRARGHLLVGVRYDDAPFGIVDDGGDLVGFDVDLAREFARRWLGDPEAVDFVQVTDVSANDRMREGRVDLIIGALSRTKGAAGDMDFSAAYFYDGLSLLVRAGAALTETRVINGPRDLDGLPVGLVEGADTEAPLLRAAGEAVPQLVHYPDYFSAVTGLENGVLAAVVGPRRTLERLARVDQGLTPRFTRDPYAIGLPKNDGAFRDLTNVTLMNVIQDGTYRTLFQRWFPGETPPDLEIWAGTSRLSFDTLSDALAPPPSTIQAIETRGFMIVGLPDDQLPFDDFDANGVARGFEAELARTLAGRWLGDVTAVQFVQQDEASGTAALAGGQIDLLVAAMPHTLPRDDEIDFSQTIYQGGIGLLVRADAAVNGLADLSGGPVAVPGGSVAANVLQETAAQAGISLSIQAVPDGNGALAGVAEGRYRALADWRSQLLNLAYANSGFLVLDERLSQRPIALGVRQGDSAFRDLVNFTLQALAVEGRFAALYDDWFGTDPPYPVEIWPGTPYRPLRLDRRPQIVPTATP